MAEGWELAYLCQSDIDSYQLLHKSKNGIEQATCLSRSHHPVLIKLGEGIVTV